MSVSVLILTRDEEANLPACLESVRWSDDVVVLDSLSTDRTVEIARAAGARVVQRPFDTERGQREASLRLGFKHPWVYNPDADEITPAELRDEMLAAVGDAARPEVAYRVRFKTFFMDRWIRYSSLYPTWVVRLFRPERVAFERSVNLRYVIQGPEGRLRNHFLHLTFNKGLEAWLAKHARYAAFEAAETAQALRGRPPGLRRLVSRDPVERRRALKEWSLRLPCRPPLRFFYTYVVRGGFLDGYPGWRYCRLMARYERMIVTKGRELRRPVAALQA
jgi:glycosyltransferase involved in cell wall biosynthesis